MFRGIGLIHGKTTHSLVAHPQVFVYHRGIQQSYRLLGEHGSPAHDKRHI